MEDPVIESMSLEVKEWFARAIVGMIWADGRIDKAELAYLKNIIGFLKDKNLISTMLAKVKAGKIPKLGSITANQQQAAYILSQLTLLSIVDEELVPKEEAFLAQVAKSLKMPSEVTQKFLNHARKQVEGKKIPAQLTVGSKEIEVHCTGLTKNEVLIYAPQAVNPYARLSLKFYKKKADKENPEFLETITGKSLWCRPIKSRFSNFVLKAEFQQTLNEYQGLNFVKGARGGDEKAKSVLKPSNSSLLGYFVECRVCGKKNIPFWLLRTKTMNTQNNIFGIPIYHKPKTGKEFCDFNLLQVVICPDCLFASNQMDHFKKQTGDKGQPPFDAKSFKEDWNKGLPIRKQLVGKTSTWLSAEKRSIGQAISSYGLGLITSDHLAKIARDEPVDHQRRSISYLLIQAELSMNKGESEKARILTNDAEKRLEGVFAALSGAQSIRSAFVLALIKIYFKKYEEAGDYLNFVKNYDRSRPVTPGSPEYRVLNQVMRPLENAWQERAEYAHDILLDFHHDDLA